MFWPLCCCLFDNFFCFCTCECMYFYHFPFLSSPFSSLTIIIQCHCFIAGLFTNLYFSFCQFCSCFLILSFLFHSVIMEDHMVDNRSLVSDARLLRLKYWFCYVLAIIWVDYINSLGFSFLIIVFVSFTWFILKNHFKGCLYHSDHYCRLPNKLNIKCNSLSEILYRHGDRDTEFSGIRAGTG